MNDPRPAAPPSPWVTRFSALIEPKSPVLDLACGTGRHTRYLAEKGHSVVALDKQAEALEPLKSVPRVETCQADLEDGHPWPLPGRQFAGIVVTNYLHRPLFPAIIAALADSGILIYETFALGNEQFGKPSNPDFLLRPGELLELVGGHLRIVAFEDGVVQSPRPAVIQRICAVRAADGIVPAIP